MKMGLVKHTVEILALERELQAPTWKWLHFFIKLLWEKQGF